MVDEKKTVTPSHSVLERVKLFRLRPGKEHTHGGFAVQANDEVYLTQTQAQAFRDKFEAVDPNAGFTAVDDPHKAFLEMMEKRHLEEVVQESPAPVSPPVTPDVVPPAKEVVK